MYDSLRYATESLTSSTHSQRSSNNGMSLSSSATTPTEEPQGTGNILCTHDGVLLKKACAELIAEMNTSGSLALVEYAQLPPRVLCVEWRPNDNILIADDSQDQGDWALVDTISQRTRTVSECRAFNVKPPNEATNSGVGPPSKPRVLRIRLDEMSVIEVKHRGQVIRFIRKCDSTVHSEFFFQHGNADIFVRSMRHLHVIELVGPARGGGGDEYVILTRESQKLSKTFAELDIGSIKAGHGDNGWLANKVFGMISNKVADNLPKSRPGMLIHGDRPKTTSMTSNTSTDNFNMLNMTSSNSASSGSQSRASSLDKSPIDSELENVKEEDEKIVNTLPERLPVVRGAPLNETQWLEFHTPDGRISDPTRIKEIIFRGGIEANLRNDVWKYLLNYYQWTDSEVERIQRRELKKMEYFSMKAQWLSMTTMQELNFSGYRDRKCQIDKDVKRTDRTLQFFAGEDNPNVMLLQGILMTYVMYNFDLGYVQGMSDLLAPILAIQENEVDAFWCFVGFMDMVFANFDEDQAGMKTQFDQLRRLLEFANPRFFNYIISHDSDNMYFCFRWLLVWYKREFDNDDVLKLWEVLWTRWPCPNFHIFISVAILDHETDIIIESKYEFTEILKHVNELAGNLDLQRILKTAEATYVQLKAAEQLPNDIRQIIGEPLLELNATQTQEEHEQDFEDGFDELVKELTPAERQQQQRLLDEARANIGGSVYNSVF